MKKRFAIIIPDQDGKHEYDLIFIVPEGMSTRMANRKVVNAINKVKRADPEGYLFEDLDAVLKPQGFETLSYIKATTTW